MIAFSSTTAARGSAHWDSTTVRPGPGSIRVETLSRVKAAIPEGPIPNPPNPRIRPGLEDGLMDPDLCLRR